MTEVPIDPRIDNLHSSLDGFLTGTGREAGRKGSAIYILV